MTLPASVAIDTNCFIYFFEGGSPRSEYLLRELFEPMMRGHRRGVASVLVLSELLAYPYQLGKDDRAHELRAAMVAMPGLVIRDVDADVADRSASLRSLLRFRLPDAIQVATALETGANVFLTNDRELLRAEQVVEVLLLDDLVGL